MKELVSVIVPVYKVPLEYLRECFDSLIAQTLRESEFIVVSDGAPEEECSICEEYTKKDSRFKFFRQDHAGVSASRNFGINHAKGEYITFVDADDWIEKETCSEAYKYAKENHSDIVFWDLFFIKDHKKIGETFFSKQNIDTLDNLNINRFKQNIIHASAKKDLVSVLPSCKIIRRELVNQRHVRFDDSICYGEDRIFNYSLTSIPLKISYLCKRMYFYRIHNSSATHKFQPNYLINAVKYISRLEHLSSNKFNTALGNEFYEAYSISWSQCYMHSQNANSFSRRMQDLTEIINANYSQKYLSYATYSNLSVVSILEMFCLKHNINVVIWIHGLTKAFVNTINSFLSKYI